MGQTDILCLHDALRTQQPFCALPAGNTSPELGGKMRQTQTEGFSVKWLSCTLQNVDVMKVKVSLKNISRLKYTKT